MLKSNVEVIVLSNRGDARGFSYSVPGEGLAFLGKLGDVHFVSSKPGAIRGNHYHLRRREATIVLPGSNWSLYWAEGPDEGAQSREFDGGTAVLVLIEARTPHAMLNRGPGELWLFAIQSEANDSSDWVVRKLV